MDFYIGVLNTCAIYSLLAMSYTLVHGTSGMFTVAHAVFFGIGAYTAAVVGTRLPPEWMLVAILAATVVSAIAGVLVGMLALKNRGQAMMLITFSMQIVFSVVLVNSAWLGAEDGMPVPPLRVGGLELAQGIPTAVLLCFLVLCSYLFFVAIENSNLGRTIRAIREDEHAVEAAGVNVLIVKQFTFTLTACTAGFAGALFAHTSNFVSPHSFSFDAAIMIITISVLGGQFSFAGAILGSVIVTTLPLLIGALGIPSTTAAAINQLAFGVIIVVVLYVRPTGIFRQRKYAFERTAGANPPPAGPVLLNTTENTSRGTA